MTKVERLQQQQPKRRCVAPDAKGSLHAPVNSKRRDTKSTSGARHHDEEEPTAAQSSSMQKILKRYHSLAVSHYDQTKRRKLGAQRRNEENTKRCSQLRALHDTTARVLRQEEGVLEAGEVECRGIEEDLRQAEEERRHAEELLRSFENSGCDEDHQSTAADRDSFSGGGDGASDDFKIGGIPARFLDLRQFPELQRRKQGGIKQLSGSKHPLINDGPTIKHPLVDEEAHIIEFTEENQHNDNLYSDVNMISAALSSSRHSSSPVNHIPNKQEPKRVYVSQSSLSHVNGTYVQDGCFNDGPLFVRAGPPRAFMGLQCSIVLRREENSRPCWKIGLVPVDRFKNKRIIAYFVAQEPTIGNAAAARYIPTEQDDENSAYFEPPSDGWFTVSQEESGSMLGRATALTIEYED